jgi:hypothetical protein
MPAKLDFIGFPNFKMYDYVTGGDLEILRLQALSHSLNSRFTARTIQIPAHFGNSNIDAQGI